MPDGFGDWRTLPRTPFGDGPAMADELLDLVLTGKKRATCWSAAEGVKGTAVGGHWVVDDGGGRARAVLKTTALSQRRFDQVDEAFALAESEGDSTLAYWRRAHQDYFNRNGGFAADMLLWCEHFELVALLPSEDVTRPDGCSGNPTVVGLETGSTLP